MAESEWGGVMLSIFKRWRYLMGVWLAIIASYGILQLSKGQELSLAHALPTQLTASAPTGSSALVNAARKQIGVTLAYDPMYTVIAYPNGDVAQSKGVCTDVVIRALRQQGVDLQKSVHDDMAAHFTQYPTRWGLKSPDTNIDHRRVLNLEVYLQRKGMNLPVTHNAQDFKAGDLVTWRVGDKKLPHIGIVSDRMTQDGTPLIIHNIGLGTQEENVLFAYDMIGHYRWQ